MPGQTCASNINFELSYNTPHWGPTGFAGEMRPIIGVHIGPSTGIELMLMRDL